MERRLLEAARKGNVDELKDLVSSNELILKEMALEAAGHTLLHVACVAGHLDVVQELLKHMPKLAKKVNAGGFSPLHIAAAQGEVEIARELLRVGEDLCFVKGRERRIPLHYAVVNGELNVMKVLLSASPESVEETTAREETVLHLAVKNNRFDAVVVLVEHLKQHKKEQVIKRQDNKGNTVLHVAAAIQNFEAIRDRRREYLEPLDVSSRSDQEIREILAQAGAKHGQSNLPSSEIVLVIGDQDNNERATSYQSVRKPAVENDQPPSLPPKDSTQGQNPLGDKPNDLLVVAVLIVTATFQAVIQPPNLKKVKTHTKNGFLAAYLSFEATTFCKISLYFASLPMIIGLTEDLPSKYPLKLSTFSMVGTYLSCMYNVPARSLQDENYSPLGTALIGTLGFLIPVAILYIYRKKERKRR
ncbi:hypothetical protein ACJRO7_020402 [Eucalyptus globulus]|uniref:PGG domain-containing protein n=1 Tax=Eucalyptus globulus TaxID=34317 RepID=A0ABD3KPC5_EUCGL